MNAVHTLFFSKALMKTYQNCKRSPPGWVGWFTVQMTHKIGKWIGTNEKISSRFDKIKCKRTFKMCTHCTRCEEGLLCFQARNVFPFNPRHCLAPPSNSFYEWNLKRRNGASRLFFFFFTAMGATQTPSSSGQDLGQKGKVYFSFTFLFLVLNMAHYT